MVLPLSSNVSSFRLCSWTTGLSLGSRLDPADKPRDDGKVLRDDGKVLLDEVSRVNRWMVGRWVWPWMSRVTPWCFMMRGTSEGVASIMVDGAEVVCSWLLRRRYLAIACRFFRDSLENIHLNNGLRTFAR